MELKKIQETKNFVTVLKNNGLFFLGKIFIYEAIYTINNGFYSFASVPLENLKIDSENIKSGIPYQPTFYYFFKKAMKGINNENINFRDSCFIEFGCGTGRVLNMAQSYNFNKIIGVEFAEELVSICNEKIKSYNHKNIEVYKMDASIYKIPEDANVMFFNNPFDDKIMLKVIENIRLSYNQKSRIIYIIYLNPMQKNCFIANGYKEIFSFHNKEIQRISILKFKIE